MVIFSSQYTQHSYTKAAAFPSVTQQSTENNNTKYNTKYKFKLKSMRSQTTVCTDNDHMVILHYLEQHFVTVACEQVHYFKW
jgi:hypothetical protein